MKRVTRTCAELRSISRAHLQVRPFHHTSAVSSPEKGGTSHQDVVNQAQASPQGSNANKSALSDKEVESSSAGKKKKTVAEMDEELRLKLEGMSGEGGAAGIEYEGGKAEGLKRGVKSNMFRVI
ncbi:hypothetical protein FJTKL_12721 [Diaporthe vaccinii]|uniref:Uncharacterized protein n=1 Tax=Diaporthe vaccinii TaxID=105482 RepID=A0ABR4ECD4_9PEZI